MRLYPKNDQKLYALDSNGNEYDLIDGPSIGARIYNSANINILNAAMTLLYFDSERYDTDNIHSTTTNTSRLTIQTAGKYLISGSVGFDANSNGYRWVRIQLNGAIPIADMITLPASNQWTVLTVATIYDLVVGDVLELVCYQNSGGSLLAPSNNATTPEFSIQKVGQ